MKSCRLVECQINRLFLAINRLFCFYLLIGAHLLICTMKKLLCFAVEMLSRFGLVNANDVYDVSRCVRFCSGLLVMFGCLQIVGVHCRMGRGRTGVMCACYLVHFLEQPPERAVINVRLMRPGSVETKDQERAVTRYHDFLRSTLQQPNIF